ncbi:MAG: hypothetical protein E7553_07805 [Ruminococcaceae bacterium]|nr:hypothetical protein [Oscillospiraceae bacterium]
MLLFVEGLVMCFVLLIVCVVGIANGPVGLVLLYEDDVQQRVVELGLITKERIRRNFILCSIALFVPLFVLPPLMVYGINGATGFWDGFWQMSVILWIQGVFDRLFIDWYWVGKTKAWDIPGTEDLKPYIPLKTLLVKWTSTVLLNPLIAAIVAGVMLLF